MSRVRSATALSFSITGIPDAGVLWPQDLRMRRTDLKRANFLQFGDDGFSTGGSSSMTTINQRSSFMRAWRESASRSS